MSLPIPQMIFGTMMMLMITIMVYSFIDPNQCMSVQITEDKQKCQDLTNMIFNSIPIAWITFIGGGVILFLIQKNYELKKQGGRHERQD